MHITVQDDQEFGRLLQALANDIVDAQVHFKLYQDLVAAYSEYAVEFGQANTFWSLTFRAHLDRALFCLCRAYDQCTSGKRILSLRSLLETIKRNLHFFDEPNFRERLRDNRFVDSVAAVQRKPDLGQLEQDLYSVTDKNPLVKKLVIWRGTVYSHLNAGHALNPEVLVRNYPLLLQEIDVLLANAVKILNRYSHLFSASVYSTNIVGKDDYLSLLRCVRESLAAKEARIQREQEELMKKISEH